MAYLGDEELAELAGRMAPDVDGDMLEDDPDEDDGLTDDDAPGPEDLDEAERADFDRNELKDYWTKGEGLKRWVASPHPWTALYRHLRKHVGAERAKRMAAQWVHEVTGNWPGSDKHRVAHGHPPRGDRIGPG